MTDQSKLLPQPLILPLPTTAIDHAGLALLPTTSSRRDLTLTPREIGYQLHVDGKVRCFKLKISPGGVGWPTQGDAMIYLALLQIARTAGVTERMSFDPHNVFDLLRWTSIGGQNYAMLRDSLERLHGLAFHFSSGTMTGRTGQEYTDRVAMGGHIIDTYRVAENRWSDSWLEWGSVVTEGFAQEDIKRLDWGTVVALGNPIAVQLYRLLDRVTLSGERAWSVGWKTLATVLGMSADAYQRPARFMQVLQPHLDRLMAADVVERIDYKRGGTFTFHVRNYLRTELRRILTEHFEVYPEAARQLVAGYDESRIMAMCDFLVDGHQKPTKRGGWLTDAIRNGYEPRYPDNDAEAFAGMCGLCEVSSRSKSCQSGAVVGQVRTVANRRLAVWARGRANSSRRAPAVRRDAATIAVGPRCVGSQPGACSSGVSAHRQAARGA